MDSCNYSVKKSPYMKEWMTLADCQKEASMFERMNGQPQFLSSTLQTTLKNR